MTTTEAPFVNVLMLPNWGQYHPLDPIRAVFYEGTIYILTQDIDNALQKPGHGHTLTGIPKEHRRRFTIHRTAKRNGERSNKFTAVTTTALQTRFESMRGLHPQLKANMLSWIKTIASGGLLKIATWHQPTATGWENHKVEVKKTGIESTHPGEWAVDCTTCDYYLEFPNHPGALAFATQHAANHAYHVGVENEQ